MTDTLLRDLASQADNKNTPWEIRIWQKVILQAIYDVMFKPKSKLINTEQYLASVESANWLQSNCKDFKQACENAGWPTCYIKKGSKKVIEKSPFIGKKYIKVIKKSRDSNNVTAYYTTPAYAKQLVEAGQARYVQSRNTNAGL